MHIKLTHHSESILQIIPIYVTKHSLFVTKHTEYDVSIDIQIPEYVTKYLHLYEFKAYVTRNRI